MGSRVPPFYPKVLWCSRRCCGCPAHASAPFTSTSRRTWCCAMLSHVRLFVTLWTVAHQAPMPMRFSRQEYWSGLPCPSPGCLSHPGIEALSPLASAMQADSFLLSYQRSPRPFATENQSDSISYLFCFFFNFNFYFLPLLLWVNNVAYSLKYTGHFILKAMILEIPFI